ncbi:30S ribosomal protein S1 [Clostridium tetani]|uniref:30S ribosomal protein S1 n=1 Tax=Clostridium tetani TaxID=1513 RepID=UPI0005135BEB|nr:30S ribosomal protein S1 [Clostridium tetani]KGI39874.1 30S ribosomal protein S1 [Clostridium tetani ATCC 9441]KGI43928.1 30S ribosomal protein S1 [Clostridium tetani]RXI46046.1 30S ribosomal protein S1 [Clostridium tetani]RXI50903.1 30S ribosomal protein S1 [Clostridium tetani]RXI51193.1 30S ribosomal protein S1 [Clostridium tetani]
MSKINEDLTMENMIEEIDKNMKKVKEKDIVKGKVISVSEDEVLINIGYVADGIIKKSDLEDIDFKEEFKKDEEVYVYVVKLNDGEGNVILSKRIADKIRTLDKLEKDFKEGNIFKIKIEEIVKGGVITHINGVRAFIPASHISSKFVQDLNEFLGKEKDVKVIEFNRKDNKLVLSAKEVEDEKLTKKREELWKTLKEGEKINGKVVRLVKFGAFVDIGGIEGLVHLSDLSWKRVNNPSDIVKEGDEVEVFILNVDKKRERLGLALKDIKEDPWKKALDNHKIGTVEHGTVVKLVEFGAFVELKDGLEGLLHISEISEERILKPEEVLKIGDKIKVKILDINKENRKMSLSKKAAEDKSSAEMEKYSDKEEGVSLGEILGDKLKDFKF